VKSYRPEMDAEEEMAYLREKRNETEKKMIREGKLRPRQ